MPERLLRLLALLQARRAWSGRELARRLGVTERTLRRDVDRLRALDYPVTGTAGTAGGYRLGSGRSLPPLVLDDEEAVAVAVGLVSAAGSGVAGVEDSAMRALVKLRQVLPVRLRPRLGALADAAAAAAPRNPTRVDPDLLATLASCCRERELVTFGYQDRAGRSGDRRVEPYHLVAAQGYWYLLAYDTARGDWRTFRVDRIAGASSTRHRFAARALPAPDPATYLAQAFARASYRHTVRVAVALPAETVRARLLAPVLAATSCGGRAAPGRRRG